MAPNAYKSPSIFKLSNLFLFTLNSTSIAIPAPDNNPPIKLPNDMAPFRNSSVSKTLETQFGISPIKLVISGATILFFKRIISR